LIVERDARALREGELAAVQLGLAGEDPEQRRLAGAVGAGERKPVATLDLERDAVEEDVPAEFLAQARCDDDCHAPRVKAWRSRRIVLSCERASAPGRTWTPLGSSEPRAGSRGRARRATTATGSSTATSSSSSCRRRAGARSTSGAA